MEQEDIFNIGFRGGCAFKDDNDAEQETERAKLEVALNRKLKQAFDLGREYQRNHNE